MRAARPELKSRVPQLVQLYEVDSSRLTVGDDGRPRMPAECGELEALIVCFDAGDGSSLEGVIDLCRTSLHPRREGPELHADSTPFHRLQACARAASRSWSLLARQVAYLGQRR